MAALFYFDDILSLFLVLSMTIWLVLRLGIKLEYSPNGFILMFNFKKEKS